MDEEEAAENLGATKARTVKRILIPLMTGGMLAGFFTPTEGAAVGAASVLVTALLKRDHGIEVKSASSTIEEVVARQFVERLARQRNITLPTGDIFADTPAQKAAHGHSHGHGHAKKPTLAKKPEPPKSADTKK